MRSRPPLGVHHGQYYGDAQSVNTYEVLTKANLQCLHERFQDIACLDETITTSGEQIWLQCYPGKEAARSSSDQIKASPNYRKWGSFQSSLALILPLAIKSGHSPGCMIRNFQIHVVLKDLKWMRKQEPLVEEANCSKPGTSKQTFHIPRFFPGVPRLTGPLETNGCIQTLQLRRIAGVRREPEVSVETKEEQQENNRPSVSLLDMPHPQSLEKCYTPKGWLSSGRWWKFESRSLPGSFPGHLHGAHMCWSGSRHEPHLLHCGLAIEHSKEPFGLTCQVSGQAYVGLYTYAFDNFSGNEERIWQVQPQPPSQDLEACIADLANQMYELNMAEMARASLSEVKGYTNQASDREQHSGRNLSTIRGHVYPSITVNGPAQLGDYMPNQY